MKKQLKQLKKVINLAENDPTTEYNTDELIYMKKRYRQLEEYHQHVTRISKRGFGYDPTPVVIEDGSAD